MKTLVLLMVTATTLCACNGVQTAQTAVKKQYACADDTCSHDSERYLCRTDSECEALFGGAQ